MTQYISKSAIVAEIERRIADNRKEIERANHKNLEDYFEGYEDALVLLKEQFLDTIEVKEVDLEKEMQAFAKMELEPLKIHDANIGISITMSQLYSCASRFFELGMRVSNPITASDRGTAEEIIINLKRVEQDYHIDLTKEMEWVRNKTQKGE